MTFSLETLIMISAIVLCLGGLIGAIVSRTLLPPENQRDLERRLESSRDELNRYQQDVAEHFAQTSQLVTNLTRAYKDVHDHLASGAIELTNAEISRKILDAGKESNDLNEKKVIEELSFEPPKDWAPKSPGSIGTLSEEFGLAESNDEDGIEQITANPKPYAGVGR